MRTLKLVFSLDNEKTSICSLADPREDLTAAEVQTAMEAIIDENVLLVGEARPVGIKNYYIQDSHNDYLN